MPHQDLIRHDPLWIIEPRDEKTSEHLTQSLAISPFLADLLTRRGITREDDARRFLTPNLKNLHNPFDLEDMDLAVSRLIRAIDNGETIAVYGDYDVDGTTSSALLYDFFTALGVSVIIYIPDRLKEGYSLNKPALDFLKKTGASIIITVDNGISSLECADYAHAIGLDLIITDHHQLGERLPVATAVVNSCRAENRADFNGVAGVGVAFYLAMALRKVLRDRGYFMNGRKEPNLTSLLDLVALGTVADIAPLTGQNRILVSCGIEIIRRGTRKGLRLLASVAQVDTAKLDTYDIGFRLGPRINAGGRIGEPKGGFYLLTAESSELARPFAAQLNAENDRRRTLEDHIVKEAKALIDSQAGFTERLSCMVAHRDWHPGVIGIVASRLVETYRRPAIVFAWDGSVWKGSARSIPGFAIHRALEACRAHILQFGGHPQAAGLSVAEDALQDFYTAFDAVTREQLNADSCRRRLLIDLVLNEAINDSHFTAIRALEPLGEKNRTPLFAYLNMDIVSTRKLSEGKHLKLTLKSEHGIFEAIAFNVPERFHVIVAKKTKVDVAFRPEKNEWQGTTRLQLHVVDLKESGVLS